MKKMKKLPAIIFFFFFWMNDICSFLLLDVKGKFLFVLIFKENFVLFDLVEFD